MLYDSQRFNPNPENPSALCPTVEVMLKRLDYYHARAHPYTPTNAAEQLGLLPTTTDPNAQSRVAAAATHRSTLHYGDRTQFHLPEPQT
jgi:hypothetical protein